MYESVRKYNHTISKHIRYGNDINSKKKVYLTTKRDIQTDKIKALQHIREHVRWGDKKVINY